MLNTWVYYEEDEVVLPAATADFVFGSATMPASWSLTRSTAALGRGPDGRWTSYAANVPRHFHDPVSKRLLGTLLEPARAQLINSSRPLVSTVKAATVTADTTTQTPFGLGATRLVDNTTLAVHGFDMFFGGANRAAAIPDGAVVSVQMTFAPIGGQTRGTFYVQLKTGIYRTVEFTVAGGTPSIINHGVDSARISADTDGFYRLEFTASFGAGTSGGAVNLSLIKDDGTRTYAGDGTRGFLIAHFGAEIGPECTSPILSSTAASTTPVARGDDILTSSADWLVSGGKSFGVQYTPLGADTQVVLSAAGGDSVELLNSGGDAVYTVLSSGTNIGPIRGQAPPAGIERTVVVTAGFSEFWLTQNGKRLSFSVAGSPPAAIDSVRVGARVGGGFAGPMILNRLKYWDEAIDREATSAFSADLSIPGIAPVLPVIDIQASRSIPASDTTIAMSVTLTGPPTGASVSYRTIDVTALAGVDYTAVSGTIVFGPGDNSSSLTIALGTRSLLDDKSFVIELFTPRAAVLGTARCTVTLVKSTPTAHAPLKVVTFDGPLSGDWAITRSTPGYARGADGIWTSIAAGLPRIHHFAPNEVGILVEPATTQCLFESLNFGYLLNSTQTIITTTQTPVSMRTKQWRETAITGNHLFRALWNVNAATWPTGDFILWLLCKPVGPRTRYRMAVKGIDNIFRGAIFELTGEGSVVSTTAADIIATVEPEPFWPGVYRIGIAKPQATNAGVAAEFDIGPVDPANNNSTTTVGNTAYGLDFYHFQVEPGLFWTSPIPVVTAAAVTPRAADVLKAAGTWYSRESFALGVQFTRLNNTPNTQRIVQFRDVVPAVDDFGILIANGIHRAPLTTGATFHGQIDGPLHNPKTVSTAVVSIDTTRYSLFVGGTKAGEIPMTGKDMPRQVEHLRFGSKEQDGSQGAPIVIKKIAYWTVGLSDEEGAVFSADLSGTPPGQVEPDPLPLVSIPANLTVPEGQSISIPVTKVGNGACSVNFRTKGQTATGGTDYTGIGDPNPAAATARIITFAANESTKLVTFQSLADAVPEPNSEKVGIEITAFNNPPDCRIDVGVGVITIAEAPTVSIQGSVSVTEGAAATMTVTKTGIGACSVTYRTVGVTATVDADYTRTDATLLSFGENETSKVISIQTAADATVEQNETFRVVIETPTNCKLGTTTSCTVTIVPVGGEAPPEAGIYAAPVGFATTTDGGIGQTPYYVTSLANTSTTGTLRHALTQSNKCIVFEIGGRWEMAQAGVTVTGSNLTVCGETAPAPGIIIQGGDFKIGAVHDVVFRHITFERGHDDRVTCFSNGDAIHLTSTNETTPCENIWFDHCAMLWSNDELISMWPTSSTSRGIVRNISFSNCLFAEPLWRPEQVEKPGGGYYRGHYEGQNADKSCKPEYNHNYGIIIGYTTRNIDIQYSAYVDCNNRCPFIDADTRTVLANNMMLNCSQGAWIVMNTYDDTVKYFLTTVAGFLAITGPNSSAYDIVRIHDAKVPPTGSKLWAKGLYSWKGVGANNAAKTTPGYRDDKQKPFILNSDTDARPIDIPNAPVPVLTADEIYQRTKDNVGPRPRDRANGAVSVQKVLTKIETQSSTWVDHPSQVGGMSTLASKTRSLQDGTGKFKNGDTIPAFPTSTDKTKVRAWLRKFLDEVQYD